MESTEDLKCYAFTPPSQDDRPSKRRRIATQTAHAHQWDLREEAYHRLWNAQEERIKVVIEQSNASTVDKIVRFVTEGAPEHQQGASKIPTGLIITGPNIASHLGFFDRLSTAITDRCRSRFILLNSGECPNLKTFLKVLIKKATSARQDEDDEVDESLQKRGGGLKILDYDLELLHSWLSKENRIDHIVIAVQDVEAFDASLLSEIIELVGTWLDRIPFTLLFGLATSTDRLQERLPGTSLRLLRGEQFDVTQTNQVLEEIFYTTTVGSDVRLRLGASLSNRLLERQNDYNQSVEAFCDALKYAYMSHFYANILSVFLHPDLDRPQLSNETFEAVRNMPSFRNWIERLLDDGQTEIVRQLLESDDKLYESIMAAMQETQTKISRLILAGELIYLLRSCLSKQSTLKSSLYVQGMSGDLNGSPITRETLLSVKKAPSDSLLQLLRSLKSVEGLNELLHLGEYERRLEELLANLDTKNPLRSEFAVRHDTLRTTVVAQKVELSKQKAKLSKEDTEYTSLVEDFHNKLKAFLDDALIHPQELFLYEIFIYDLRSPHIDVFMAKPRFVLERALSCPHDYLNCDCCPSSRGGNNEEGTLSSKQPPTALLYQLYLESGSLINVSDLWSAFHSIVTDEDDPDPEGQEAMAMALFQRALAELKYLGMLKPSRKKVDHVAKTMWKGL